MNLNHVQITANWNSPSVRLFSDDCISSDSSPSVLKILISSEDPRCSPLVDPAAKWTVDSAAKCTVNVILDVESEVVVDERLLYRALFDMKNMYVVGP